MTKTYFYLLSRAFGVAAMAATLSLAGPAFAGADTNMNMNMNSGMNMMGGVDTSEIPRIPPVAGYSEGMRIFFLHTEISDPDIGAIMTEMMGSPVPVVPSLADAPASMLANVWAFTNGIQPDGPRGPLDYQPDIFDFPVGSDGYRPLRALQLVTWAKGATPRLLASAAALDAAIANNEVSVKGTGVVVNAPFLTWPDGNR
jgi:hypothetical protein